jgi:hypothetical protein
VTVEEHQCLVMRRDRGGGEIAQRIEDSDPIAQLATGKLADHERVAQHKARIEQVDQRSVATPEVAGPDRRIDRYHRTARRGVRVAVWRHRRGARAFTSLPPSRASLRAASRSTNACNASRNTAERPVVPTAMQAILSNSSSIVTVVRMRNS